MAWYAYWKWCHWWMKRPVFNWIEWYKEEIKTPEQRAEEEAKYKHFKESLAMTHTVMSALPNYGIYSSNKW